MTRLLVSLLLALSTAALAAPSPSVIVVLVRHAEAESGGPDPALSPAGRARAECIAKRGELVGVTHVITSPYRRTTETATIVASARGLEALPRDPMKADALARELRALPAGSRALVVGHSNTVPMLASALGVTLSGLVDEGGQKAIPRAEHDRIAVIELAATPKLTESRQGCAKATTSSADAPNTDLQRRLEQFAAAALARDAKGLYAMLPPEGRTCLSEAEFVSDDEGGRFTRFRHGKPRELSAKERSEIESQCSPGPLAVERAVVVDAKVRLVLPDGSVHPLKKIENLWVLIDGEWWWYNWDSPALRCP